MAIRKAERRKARLRLALTGVSGSGKTWSALTLARGLGGKIGMIDTEAGSSELYAPSFDFDVLDIAAPFACRKYIEAIREFEKAGYDGPPEKEEPDEPEESEEVEVEEESSDEVTDEVTDEAEEVEYEGKAYKLPKELKDALLRQQDYTRKTQEVAEKRRSIEEQAASVEFRQKFQEAHFAKAVEAQSLQSQLQQYSQVNWAELAESNPSQYLQLDRQHRQLQDAYGRINADIQQLGQQFAQKTQQDKNRLRAKCIEELRKDFKDFGPELLKSLDETGKSFGFSGEELSEIADPRMIRVLHAAWQFNKLRAGKSIVEKKVSEARPVQAKGARSANTVHVNAQVKDARDRLKKTGKASDAESYLAARFAKSMR